MINLFLTKRKHIFGLLVKSLVAFVLVFVSGLIFFKTLDYYQSDYWNGYLLDKKEVYEGIFRLGFLAHIATAPFLSFISVYLVLIQKNRFTTLHRILGKGYVIGTLFVSAPSGFILSFYAFGGWVSQLSFAILSVLWFYFTLKAFLAIKTKNIDKHRLMMNRSFVLLTSAVLLRIFSFISIHYFQWSGEVMYTCLSIGSWGIPFFMFEILRPKTARFISS